MADNPTPTPEAAPAGKPDEPPPEKAQTPAASGGGLKAWLPLIITLVASPALAYVTTAFVLVPKVQKAAEAAALTSAEPATPAAGNEHKPSADAHAPAAKPKPAAHKETAKEKGKEHGKEADGLSPALKEKGAKITANGRITVPLNKVLVNIAGTMGSRYLLGSVTLSGEGEEFAEQVVSNEAQLLDLAAGVLASKTITDLEKPSARSVIRSELLTVFNNVLGAGTVQEVYLTELAVQ